MLVLNKDKEELLVSKYGFVKKTSPIDINNCWYTYKTMTIRSITNPYKTGKVDIGSVSLDLQDKLYQLIKEDVLICVPNEDKQAKILKIEEKIKKMQEQIDKLKKEED